MIALLFKSDAPTFNRPAKLPPELKVETPATLSSSKSVIPSTVRSVRTPRLPDTVTPRPVVSNFF